MLRTVLLALALALALSGESLFLGGYQDLASADRRFGMAKTVGDADPNGATAVGDVGTVLDPNGATTDLVGMHDPNG